MPKKRNHSSVMTAALLSVISSSVVITAAMTNAEGDLTPVIVSYSGGSANPYQSIVPYQPNTYTPGYPSIQVSSSRRTVLPKNVLNRKIKVLSRTIKSVHKRLMAAEDKIDVLERTMATVSGDTTGIQDTLRRLTNLRDQLSNHLAKLESDLADMKLQLADAE